jgi:hypothetical protein
MIAAASVRALRDHLGETYGLTYLDPRDPAAGLGLRTVGDALRAVSAFVLRSFGVTVPLPDLSRVSMTLGPLVPLSEASVATLEDEIETIVHEAQHGAQQQDGGTLQAAVDYLAAELRARAEADAYAAGLFARYLVTGIPVTEDEAAARLTTGPYHLAPPEVDLARRVVRSHVATINAGLCPPISAAIEAYAFLRRTDPAAIVVQIQ